MFRDLIPLLADRFHIVAPDLPGFGQSDMRRTRRYTFDNIAGVIDRFTEIVGFDRYAVYVFDYGAPTGFRLAVRHPERITAIISQNGNAYEEGLSDGWNPIRAYWEDPSPANREALRAFLKPEATAWQYTHGVSDATRVSPDGYSLDNFYLAGPERTTSSSTCSATTRATSRSTRLPDNISARISRHCWRCGARTIRSFCLPAPRRISATSRTRGAILRHRPFRARDACGGNCGSHSRICSSLTSLHGSAPRREEGLTATDTPNDRLRAAASCECQRSL